MTCNQLFNYQLPKSKSNVRELPIFKSWFITSYWLLHCWLRLIISNFIQLTYSYNFENKLKSDTQHNPNEVNDHPGIPTPTKFHLQNVRNVGLVYNNWNFFFVRRDIHIHYISSFDLEKTIIFLIFLVKFINVNLTNSQMTTFNGIATFDSNEIILSIIQEYFCDKNMYDY